MLGILLSAKQPAAELAARIKMKVAEAKLAGDHPKLAVLLVEGDPASAFYAKAKQKLAAKLGVSFELLTLPAQAGEAEMVRVINAWNRATGVHGIMVELPLPKSISTRNVIAAVAPEKDIDGLTPANRLAALTGGPGLYPATPQSCIRLAAHYGYYPAGRSVTLIGRGQTVGMPLLHLLIRANATVTLCHSHTADLVRHIRGAELLFVAAGRPGLVTASMVHPELTVIDAGINEMPDGSIRGDVSPDVAAIVRAMSPTPGGVGTLTTMILFENLLKAIKLQKETPEVSRHVRF